MSLVRQLSVACILGLFLLTGLAWPSNLLYNGGFQTGSISGWSPFATSNGTIGTTMPTVVPITVNSSTNEGAQFQVGQVAFDPNDQEGGGIQQSIMLPTGQLTLSADISFYDSGTFANSYAGEALLLVDGVAVASYTAGPINPGQLITNTLSYNFTGNGQQATIGVEFLRPADSVTGLTPTQTVWNIDLEDPSGVLGDPDAPEPATWLMAGLPLLFAGIWKWKRRPHQA